MKITPLLFKENIDDEIANLRKRKSDFIAAVKKLKEDRGKLYEDNLEFVFRLFCLKTAGVYLDRDFSFSWHHNELRIAKYGGSTKEKYLRLKHVNTDRNNVIMFKLSDFKYLNEHFTLSIWQNAVKVNATKLSYIDFLEEFPTIALNRNSVDFVKSSSLMFDKKSEDEYGIELFQDKAFKTDVYFIMYEHSIFS